MVSAYPVLAIILLRVTPLAKRNSYRVAKGAHHQQWAIYIIVIPLQHQRMEDDMHSVTPNRPTPPFIYIGRTSLLTSGHKRAPDRVGLGLLMKYERLNSTV